MLVYQNTQAMIGNTPMVKVNNLDTGPCQLFLKLENYNPGGSIKDRIALTMIEAAEKTGQLKPGGTIVEATAGNTGLGLALIAALKGYRLVIVMPDKMSQEKIAHLKALGAEVVMTRSDVAKGHPDYYQDIAERLAQEMHGYYINQFGNPANVKAHEEGTAPEIWEQMQHNIDAIVLGVGSGGTITGIGRYLKKVAPHIEIILADPAGSVLTDYLKTGTLSKPGAWLVEGIGEDFIPPICDLSLVDQAITVTDKEALLTARELLQKEGILAGSSSGNLLFAALQYCRAQTQPKRVVTLICDTGNKYLSKMYNDNWMSDHGLLSRQLNHDLRDLIARPHRNHATIAIKPHEPLNTALVRMRDNGISQLPVLDENRVVGLIDEATMLSYLSISKDYLHKSVSETMQRNIAYIAYNAPIEHLQPIFANNQVAMVMDGDNFLGLITRIDLLNHLARTA